MPLDRPTIGGQTFLRVEGPLDRPGNMYEMLARNHVDGVGLREVAKRAVPTELFAKVDVGVGLWAALLNTYKLMQGSSVTVAMNGGSVANVFVLEVALAREPKRLIKCIQGVNVGGGGSADLVETVWRVIYPRPT